MKKRQVELDLLRIIAMLAVIVVHTCGIESDILDISNANWQRLTFLAALMTWEVPVFVMISGRFFLDPERNIGITQLFHAITRLVIAFVIWDVVYQFYYIVTGEYKELNWKGILSQGLIGPYHFWFIHMLIGVYLVTPLLRKITTDKNLMEYFIVLYLITSAITYYGPDIPFIGDTISSVVKAADFQFVLGYSVYFILGYYLYRYPIDTNKEIILYILGIVCLVGASYLTVKKSILLQVHSEWYTRYIYPNSVISSSAIYVLFVKRIAGLKFGDSTNFLITTLSKWSFGVYLCHALILELIGKAGVSLTCINPFITVPIIAFVVSIICFIIVMLIRCIPYIGEKIT